jgi:DHA2 family multidrug resistance protein
MTQGTDRASASYLRLVTLAVLIPSWMALIDGTIVNVGLDTIAGNLGATIDEASWISSIYVVAGVFVMPLTGWLSANIGRKKALLSAIVLFTVGSLLCAASQTLDELIVTRFIQGIGGGLMLPLAMAALVDAYPHDDLATAFRVYGVAVMAGPSIGPAIGGWILANMSWPWIFIINVPLGIGAFFLGAAVLRDQTERGERSKFNWTSLALMIAGFWALQFVLQEGPRREWFADPQIVLASIVAVVALSVFVRTQITTRVPLVDLKPLAIPSYAIGITLSLITGVGFAGVALIVPLYMQDVLRYAPDFAGYIMVPTAVGSIIGTELSGRISKVVPPAALAALSLVLCAAGTLWFAHLGDRISFGSAVLPRAVQGIGLGLLYVPLNVLMLSHMPRRLYDAASGLGSLVRQLGAGFGYAILGGLIVRMRIGAATLTASGVRHSSSMNDPGMAAINQWFVAHGYSANDASTASLAVLRELVFRAATAAAYSETFIIIALLFMVSLPFLVLFYLVPKTKADPA